MTHNDEYYDYGMYENYNYEPKPPRCIICNKNINPKNYNDDNNVETEFYIIAGSYFDDLYHPSSDFEPLDYCCISCYKNILLPFIKQKEQQYELYNIFNLLRNDKNK